MNQAIPIPEIRKKKPVSQAAITLLLCFAVPFLAMILLYCIRKTWPLGEESILVLDMNSQYIYYLEEFRNILVNGDSILYSFNRALGGEFMGIFAYYLSSPFSVLVALFPQNMITESVYLILVLKCGACGLSFGYLLHKTRRLRSPYLVMFATMYALSSFAVVMQSNLMWTDNIIAFPLILLAIDQLIRHGKYRLYVIALAYSILSNFYLGYMSCLFILIWFFLRYFMLSPEERNPTGESAHFVRSLAQIFWWSMVAILISCIIILPIYYSLAFGKLGFSTPDYKAKQMFDFADLLTKAFFGSYDNVRTNGMPFLYCGTLSLILAPLYFFTPTIPTRRKIGFGIIMLFFIVSFNYNVLDLIWHGFQRPNWLNARFAYMFVGLELVMAADVLVHLRKTGTRLVAASGGIVALLIILLDKIGYDHIYDFSVVWSTLLFVVLIAAILPFCIRNMKNPAVARAAAPVLCVVMILEVIANGALMMKRYDEDVIYTKRASYRDFIDKYLVAAERLPDDGTFYRAEKLSHRRKNDNFPLGLNGLSNSTTTLNARVISLLRQFGLSARSHWTYYVGGNPVTDSLFGIQYLIADPTDSKGLPDYLTKGYTFMGSTADNLALYENPTVLSIAYAVDNGVVNFDTPAEEGEEKAFVDPFTYHNELLSAMLGEEITVWTAADKPDFENTNCKRLNIKNHDGYEKTGSNEAKLTYTLTIDSDKPLYFYIPSEYPRDCTLKLNGKSLGTYFGEKDYGIKELGTFAVGEEITVELVLKETYIYPRKNCDFFYYFDEEAFRSSMETLSAGTMDAYSDSDDHITGTITVPESGQIVFTTIPYDEGWQITVDGEEAEIFPVLNDTLLAFRCSAGKHDLEFTYRPDCVKNGLIFTGIGLAAFLFLSIADSLREKKRREALLAEGGTLPTDIHPDALWAMEQDRLALIACQPESVPAPTDEENPQRSEKEITE